jgi:O-antigen/teichoic acid export membrane protein
VSWVMMKVCFPGFSRIQDDDERLRGAYVKVISVTAFITWPALAFAVANTAPAVDVFLGPQWSFIVAPLRLMCIAGCSISVVALTGSVILAKGRAALDLKLSAFAMVFLALTMVASVRYGLVGVSVGFLIYTLISNSISQYYANKVLALPPKSFLLALLPGAITAVAVGMAVYVAGSTAHRFYGNYASVGASVGAAVIVFTVLAYALRRRDIIVLKDYVSSKIKPSFSSRLADVYRSLVS